MNKLDTAIKHISCGGILFDTDMEYIWLVNKLARGDWRLPKGHVEDGESITETALREVREETGHPYIKALDAEPLVIEYNFEKDGEDNHKTVYFIPIQVTKHTRENTAQMKLEGLSGEWIALDKAVDKLTYENEKDVAKKMLRTFASLPF